MKKLKTTRKLKENTLLRVYRKGFGYSKITVIDVHELYIGARADREFMNNVQDGEYIEAYLWVENTASFRFTLEVIGRITGNPHILFFSHTDHLIREEKRHCLMADTSIPVRFFLFDTGNTDKKVYTEEVTYHLGTIIRLSDREAVLKSTDTFEEIDFIKGSIKLLGKEIQLLGKITPHEKDDNHYNVEFSGMAESDRNNILDYIFSIYREQPTVSAHPDH